MNAMKNRIHLLVFLGLCGTGALAQTTPGGEYYINGVFNPVIADAKKLDLVPQPIDTVLPNAPMTYDMIPVRGEVPQHPAGPAAPLQRLRQGGLRPLRDAARGIVL